MILNRLNLSERIYARKCDISVSNNKSTKKFFDDSHLQGHRNASIVYVLTMNGDIQCSASFSKHKTHQWEVIRYACKTGVTVAGGFQRLFKRFVDDHNPTSVLTFADKRISTGNLYKNSEFKPIEDVSPNYFYYKNGVVLSRQKCQKHKLSKLLGNNFNKSSSEFENMLNNGFGRVYDAGHRKMLWSK